MGQKSRALGSGGLPGSLEKRKKDKTVLVLDGLVSDLARRAQSAIDGNGPTQHLESIRAIHRLLGQIQKLERPFVSQPNVPDTAARLNILEDWLQQRGVRTVGLKLEGGLPEGAGVVAQQVYEKGQLLCTVPANVMMTTATAIRSKDDVGILFKADRILQQIPTLILALHLLFEKHRPQEEPSFWAGYIASLPGQVPPPESNADTIENFVTPLAFSLETIEALKGTAVLVEMHKAVRNYARQYAHVRLLLKQLRLQSSAIDRANSWFTWAEFRWAASIVMTRQNPIPGTPDMEMGQALALIPFLDMFNHEEGDITCHFAVKQQQMELTAKRTFQAGEQVYISYGNRPNSALLLYSGFVPDNNSKDRIKVPVELPPSDPLHSKKVALLKWLELPASGWLELYHDGTPSPELATWVKVAIMQDLSVVTESLRAAIASRAQETAAMLQYKAALREAEQKVRKLELQGQETNAGNGDTAMADGVSQNENGSLLVEVDQGAKVETTNDVPNKEIVEGGIHVEGVQKEEITVPVDTPTVAMESQDSSAEADSTILTRDAEVDSKPFTGGAEVDSTILTGDSTILTRESTCVVENVVQDGLNKKAEILVPGDVLTLFMGTEDSVADVDSTILTGESTLQSAPEGHKSVEGIVQIAPEADRTLEDLVQSAPEGHGSLEVTLPSGPLEDLVQNAPEGHGCSEGTLSNVAEDHETLEPGDGKTSLSESLEHGGSKTGLSESLDLGDNKTGLSESLELGDNKTGLSESVEWGDTGVNEHVLGEQLFPAEASLLAEICRLRLYQFGKDSQKENAGNPQLPQGLGLGLTSGLKNVHHKNPSNEYLMALKIRQQEQATLLKAIYRGSKYHTHSLDCHCH